DTTSITDQKMSDSPASTFASFGAMPKANRTLKAYSGLVPMSPKTTPSAPSARMGSRRRPAEDEGMGSLGLSFCGRLTLLTRLVACNRPVHDLAIGVGAPEEIRRRMRPA